MNTGTGTSNSTELAGGWAAWAMLVIFIFMGFESALLAVAMKGPWLILLGPALVCSHKAYETWRDISRPSASSNDSN